MMTVAFVVAVAFMVMTPGPDSLAIADAALRSRAAGVATALGAVAGLVVFTAVACTGLGALLVAAPVILDVLRVVGGIYLILVGFSALRSAVRAPDGVEGVVTGSCVPQRVSDRARRFGRGFLVDVTNPKTLVVFVAIVPAFAGPDADFGTLVGHCLFLVVFAAAWFLLVALFGAGMGSLGPRTARWAAIATGGVMCGFGLAVLVFDPFVRN
jgi:threonine/homoserine/homoserine lactone efflux protein